MAAQDAAALREWQAQQQAKKQQGMLMDRMQVTAISMLPTRKYHVRNSRANIFLKKQVLKKAAVGISPLSLFGFVPNARTSVAAPNKDVLVRPMETAEARPSDDIEATKVG